MQSPQYGTISSQRTDFSKLTSGAPGPGNYKIDRSVTQGPKFRLLSIFYF